MNPEPRIVGDTEDVCFDADIHGNTVRIEVARETIEDHLGAESLSDDERLEFIKRNRSQIVEHVKAYLREAPDVTGMRVGDDQLKHCR